MKCTGVLRRLTVALGAIAVVGLLTGCSGRRLSTREKGTFAGTAIGAGTGAIIGAAVGAPAAGAAIGGALGAGGGYVIGNAIQNEEIATAHTRARLARHQREIKRNQRALDENVE